MQSFIKGKTILNITITTVIRIKAEYNVEYSIHLLKTSIINMKQVTYNIPLQDVQTNEPIVMFT
jgi:hypothetical protein